MTALPRALSQVISLLERQGARIAWVVAGLTLAVGIPFAIHTGAELRTWDEIHYNTIAHNIVDFHMFSIDGKVPTAFRPPGYPAYLAALIFLGANTVALRASNFVLMALTLLLYHRLLARLLSPAAAAIAVLMSACYAIQFYSASALYPQPLNALLLVAMAYLHLVYFEKPAAFAASGVLYGLNLLAVPAMIFIAPALPVWHWLNGERRAAALSLATLAIAGVITGAWSIRNQQVAGKFVFISCNGGKNLLYGNSENATASSGTEGDIEAYVAQSKALGNPLHSIAEENFYQAKAVEYIKAHPLRCMELYVGKFLYYFNYWNKPATEEVHVSTAQRIVLFVTFVPLLLLALARIALGTISRTLTKPEILFALLVFGNALFCAIFITRLRFRLPFDYFLIALAANQLLLWIKLQIPDGLKPN